MSSIHVSRESVVLRNWDILDCDDLATLEHAVHTHLRGVNDWRTRKDGGVVLTIDNCWCTYNSLYFQFVVQMFSDVPVTKIELLLPRIKDYVADEIQGNQACAPPIIDTLLLTRSSTAHLCSVTGVRVHKTIEIVEWFTIDGDLYPGASEEQLDMLRSTSTIVVLPEATSKRFTLMFGKRYHELDDATLHAYIRIIMESLDPRVSKVCVQVNAHDDPLEKRMSAMRMFLAALLSSRIESISTNLRDMDSVMGFIDEAGKLDYNGCQCNPRALHIFFGLVNSHAMATLARQRAAGKPLMRVTFACDVAKVTNDMW